MQSLQPDPAARYRNVLEALWRIIRTEGLWRPMRGLNVTATGAGPAHALYFACYEKLKKTLSDVIHPGGNSHIANGAAGCVATLLHDAAMNPAEGNDSATFPSVGSCIGISGLFLYFCLQKKAREQLASLGGKPSLLLCLTSRGRSLHVVGTEEEPLGSKLIEIPFVFGASLKKDMALLGLFLGLLGSPLCSGFDLL